MSLLAALPRVALAGVVICSTALPVALHASATHRLEPVDAPHGMVVAGHPEATEAGVQMLRAGGSAMDAAVAVSLALGVAEPYGSGLGGRIVIVYYEAATKRVSVVHGVESVSRALDVDAYRKLPSAGRSIGATAVCVPGLPAALHDAHRRWGRLPWADNARPAIKLAREGFLVLPLSVKFFQSQEKKLRRFAEIGRLYLPRGKLPVAGTRLPNPDLAATLELFAQKGPEGFYRGPVAEAIVASVRAGGGTMTLEDLAQYRSEFSEAARFTWGDAEIFTSPPPFSGGTMIQLAMQALEGATWPGETLRDPRNLDRVARVVQRLYPLVQAEIGDVPDTWERYRRLTGPETTTLLRSALTTPGRPLVHVSTAMEDEGQASSTTHFAVADAEGNIACITQSTGYHFGSGIVAHGTGVVLNNWMNSLTYGDRKSPNYVAPGRRGRSTTSPTLVLRGGEPVLAVGVPGGQRIPVGVLQVLLDYLAFNRSVGEAIGDTRFHVVRPASADDARNKLEFEYSLPVPTAEALRQLGWNPRIEDDPEHFGGVNAIEFLPGGVKRGWADPRRTNAAAGY